MGFFDFLGSKPKTPDFGPLRQQANIGAQAGRRIATSLRPSLSPLTEEFRKQSQKATAGSEQRRRALAEAFKSQIGEGIKAKGTQQFDIAKQQILGALPEAQRATREALSATGGLQRGAASTALAGNVIQAQQSLGDIASGIALQSRDQLNKALGDVFQSDLGFELTKLGLDQSTAQTLLDLGREDLIREAAQLADIERQRTTDVLGIGQAKMEADAARRLANAQQRSDLLRSVIGLGGTVLGGAFGGPAGAMVGKTAADTVSKEVVQ